MSNTEMLSRLRDATRELHKELEAVPFARALSTGEVSVGSYATFLSVMGLLHAAVARALHGAADEHLQALAAVTSTRAEQAQTDFESLTPPPETNVQAMREAVCAAEDILRDSLAWPESTVGALYFVQGSRHGARQLEKPVRARFEGMRMGFWTCAGDGLSRDWPRLLTVIERIPADQADVVCASAAKLFVSLRRAMEAMHPEPTVSAPPAAMINPQAGSHAVVTDGKVLAASIMAALRCWQRYPYFEARWSERGRRFASSDSAWLATLIGEPPIVVGGQVAWLRRVLASRGMPTVLLETHLRLLLEEAAIAGIDSRACAGLHEVTDELQRGREDRGADALGRMIAAQLAEMKMAAPIADVAELVASAVVDERDGIAEAVPSLMQWIGDAALHGERWAEVATALVDSARASR